MPTKDEYYQWIFATFGSDYDICHDGLNTASVTSLTGEAHEKALTMLYKGVELRDSRAAEALAAMNEVNALSDLRAQLAQSSGESKVRVACAINKISPDESLSKDLVDVLEDSSLFWGPRMSAAIGLCDFRDEMSERALLKAVEHDGDYLVRYHASNTLIKRWRGSSSNILGHRDIFDLISEPSHGPINKDQQERLRNAIMRLEGLRKEVG